MENKFFDCEIYRYKIKNTQTQYIYSFISTKIKKEEAIKLLIKNYVLPGFPYKIYCNNELIYKIKRNKKQMYDSTKTNGTKDGEHFASILPA